LPCVSSCQDTKAVMWTDRIDCPLLQFLQSSHPEAVKGTYGDNFERLVTIKNKYDPHNFFKHTVWPTGHSERKTGNPLMTYAHGYNPDNECSGQERRYAEEDSKIGMEGVEAVTQIAESQTDGSAVKGDDGMQGVAAKKTRGLGENVKLASHPEKSPNLDGRQIA
jgi:gentisate 1,2-dioxygenase